MYAPQTTATFPISLSLPLRTASAVWYRTARLLRASGQAPARERIASRLCHHLRRDIGEIDCRPPMTRRVAWSSAQSLETMWLRYF